MSDGNASERDAFHRDERSEQADKDHDSVVTCPHMLPVILSALDFGLTAVVEDSFEEDSVGK